MPSTNPVKAFFTKAFGSNKATMMKNQLEESEQHIQDLKQRLEDSEAKTKRAQTDVQQADKTIANLQEENRLILSSCQLQLKVVEAANNETRLKAQDIRDKEVINITFCTRIG
jgi:hypothetical protein